ncbi:TIGR03086 family metal-binding protein [Streptomyces iconiensis]|uniref:TIGR03086 family metal-binding protein n=1 Tax=Streptomyces iconiensis TaxID=1384038 RepID=A0ABT6ZQZ0_9ACTN|nr:TIGR03086 family metal-binding protein [Streptomyces iconiensis]MDJ1131262.1 TIGR03086 family metal-binding protein [Streptomyces iconiensis]
MIDLKPACRQMIGLLASVGDEQLTKPTPCSEYTVRDLIAHFEEAARGLAAIARGDSGEGEGGGGGTESTASAESVPAPVTESVPAAESAATMGPGDQWRERVATSVRVLGDAWSEPGAWVGRTDGPGVELANELWGKIALTEMVVHGWDMARATDQPFALPHETLRACFDHVVEFVPKAPVEGLWGPTVEVPADAPLLDQLVGLTGRHP